MVPDKAVALMSVVPDDNLLIEATAEVVRELRALLDATGDGVAR